jgi:hypothetical protein
MKARTFVRIPCRSHAHAKEFALRLEADGYDTVRRWKAVVARTETSEEAERLARKLQVACVTAAPKQQPQALPERHPRATPA